MFLITPHGVLIRPPARGLSWPFSQTFPRALWPTHAQVLSAPRSGLPEQLALYHQIGSRTLIALLVIIIKTHVQINYY